MGLVSYPPLAQGMRPAQRGLSARWRASLLANVERLAHGTLSLQLPDGTLIEVRGQAGGEAEATLIINRWRAVRRLIFGGELGFAEAYADGEWLSPDLPALLGLALCNEDALRGVLTGWAPARLFNRIRHVRRANTRRGSRRNIAAHYDLGNAFYRQWLDPSMTYSAALFADGDDDLERAQRRKYHRLADLLDLAPGQRLLEIGCGWGGFALIAAREYGCQVTALTLSQEQAAWAREQVQAAGLADRIDIRLEDYRDVDGCYDRIASIEMFEAVGEAYWPLFFRRVNDLLRPGGVAAMQVITIEDERFETYRRSPDFIQTYIFPGGMLPSPSILAQHITSAGLGLTDRLAFGADYARTLALWRQRFLDAWPRVRNLGFDERFRRLWDYYLGYCEAGFRAASVDVAQYRLVKPA